MYPFFAREMAFLFHTKKFTATLPVYKSFTNINKRKK